MTTRHNQLLELNEIVNQIYWPDHRGISDMLKVLNNRIEREYGKGMVYFKVLDWTAGKFQVGADKFQIVRKDNGGFKII